MTNKQYQTLLVISATIGTLTLATCIGTVIAQHQAVLHHAAHFEADSWGLTSFHWNDERAQIIDSDPADSLTPPPIKTK